MDINHLVTGTILQAWFGSNSVMGFTPELTNMTGWKIYKMNESMYFLLKIRGFSSHRHVQVFRGCNSWERGFFFEPGNKNKLLSLPPKKMVVW